MYNSKFRKIFIAVGTFALLSAAALWSFNTLSELIGGPQAQYRHVIAAIAVLLVLKWGLRPNRDGHGTTRFNHQQFHVTGGNTHEH